MKTNTIRDEQGRNVKVTDSNRVLFDLAWAQDNFGSFTDSSIMVDNKVLTPIMCLKMMVSITNIVEYTVD